MGSTVIASPPRIGTIENIADWARLIVFFVATVLAFSAPGVVLALAMPKLRYFILLVVVLVILAVWFNQIAGPLPGAQKTRTSFRLLPVLLGQARLAGILFLAYCLFVAVVVPIGTPLSMLLIGRDFFDAWKGMMIWIALGLASVPVTAVGMLVWLRTLERGDSAQDAPQIRISWRKWRAAKIGSRKITWNRSS